MLVLLVGLTRSKKCAWASAMFRKNVANEQTNRFSKAGVVGCLQSKTLLPSVRNFLRKKTVKNHVPGAVTFYCASSRLENTRQQKCGTENTECGVVGSQEAGALMLKNTSILVPITSCFRANFFQKLKFLSHGVTVGLTVSRVHRIQNTQPLVHMLPC